MKTEPGIDEEIISKSYFIHFKGIELGSFNQDLLRLINHIERYSE